MTAAPRLFFYVQHLLGIGHLARASRIAAALADEGFEVTVAMGGTPVPGFPGPQVKTLALPPIRSRSGFSHLEDSDGNPVDAAFKIRRRDLLLAGLKQCQPDIVIIEAFPFGRRQMRFELLPMVEAAQAMRPRPLIASSVRDILQENTRPGRAGEIVDLVAQYFDLVLVHGDPLFARLDQTFRLADAFAAKTAYTGLVAAPPPQPGEKFDVVVSAGGGAAGHGLLRAAVAAAGRFPEASRWCVITGTGVPQCLFDSLKAAVRPGVELHAFRRDFPALLGSARLSVSQVGYNTVCDILQAQCRSLLIPFADAGETEQTRRAEQLKALGLAEIVQAENLTAEKLAAAIGHCLSQPKPPAHGFDLAGARRTANLLKAKLMEFRRGQSA